MIEDCEEQITEMLEDVQIKIKGLKECKPSEKNQKMEELSTILKDIRQELDIFNSEIQILSDYDEKKEYEKKYDICDSDCKRLENEFDMIRLNSSKIQGEIAQIGKMSEKDKQKRALKHGSNLLKDSKRRAENIKLMIGNANMLVTDINDEIKEQNQRMVEMEDLIKDAQSEIKRANQLVGFFAKAFYKDLFMKIAIAVVAILIIIICVASVAKNNKKKENENPTPAPTPVRLAVRLLEEAGRGAGRMFVKK